MCVIETTPRIETRRLTLRAPLMEDAPRLAELCNDFDISRMTSRMPWPYALGDAEDFIAGCAIADRRTDINFMIDHDDAGVVGGLGFFRNAEDALEVGYWIGKPFQGRGLASEALVGAMDWAARGWKKRVVSAAHFSDNPASGRVLCRAGFLYTGRVELRDSLARGETVPCRSMVWLA